MGRKKSDSITCVRKLILGITIYIILVIYLFPIIHIFLASFKPEAEIFSIPPTILPRKVTLEHYERIMKVFNFPLYLRNSLIIAVFSTLISVSLGSIAAYGFSRYKFPASRAIFLSVLLSRMLPPISIAIPLYVIFRHLGLLDTPIAVILGHCTYQIPFVIWLMKSFFDDIPHELEEAGLVDGMSPFQVFRKITLPLSIPGLTVATIFAFMSSWNDLIFAVTLTMSDEARTIPVGMSFLQTETKIYWGEIAAIGFIHSIPLLLITFILQKYLVKGLTLGAIKG